MSPASGRGRARRALIALLVLVGLGTSGVVCQRVAERGRFVDDFSSYGSGPGGTRALYRLAEELGARPQRWAEDLAALPPEGGMLVALGGCDTAMAREVSRYEATELEQWVASGGVLVVAGARHYLPKSLGVHFEAEPRCRQGWSFLASEAHDAEKEGEAGDGDDAEQAGEGDDAEQAGEADDAEQAGEAGEAHDAEQAGEAGDGDDAEQAGEAEQAGDPDAANIKDAFGLEDSDSDVVASMMGELSWSTPAEAPLLGLEPIPMRKPGRLFVDDDADARVVLTMPDAPDMPDSPVQHPTGVVVRHRAGWVVALASASMLQNRSLATAEGGVLFARLLDAYAPQGPVLFDEYHLGVGERRSPTRYLRQMGATPFVLQLALVVMLLLWRGGARFGAPRSDPEPAPPGTASHVATLGHLFERAHDPAGAGDLIARHALGRVAAHHHLEPAPAHKLARTLEARGDTDAAEAVKAIHQAGAAIGKDGLPRAVTRMDAALARATSRR